VAQIRGVAEKGYADQADGHTYDYDPGDPDLVDDHVQERHDDEGQAGEKRSPR